MEKLKTKNIDNEAWWVSTTEFLPHIDERVLIISKFGHVSNAIYSDLGLGKKPLFHPDGLRPHEDVKWWMQIPTDGWNDIKKVEPKDGEVALTMGMYGNIYSGVWRRPIASERFCFQPFVWEVLFWRPMPKLPSSVKLAFE